jgi:hypothetical protein
MMTSSEKVNLPAWRSQRGFYEIWFVVLFDLDRRAATWVRYSTFSPANGDAPIAMVYAADFDNSRSPTTMWAKNQFDIAQYQADPAAFAVKIGTSSIAHGSCSGQVTSAAHSLAWEFQYHMGDAPVRRTPAVFESMELGTQSVHAAVDSPATGYIEIDGVRRDIARGTAVQMHLFGTRRVDELAWLWAPEIVSLGTAADDALPASLEVISARTRHSFIRRPFGSPRVTSIFFKHGDELDDLTQFPEAMRPHVHQPAPGVLDVAYTSTLRAIRIRAYAALSTFAGWEFHHPTGNSLYVAQSDIATCMVETFERAHPFAAWQPRDVYQSQHRAALELHGAKPIEGISYIGWAQQDVTRSSTRAVTADPETPPPPNGQIIDCPQVVTLYSANDVNSAFDILPLEPNTSPHVALPLQIMHLDSPVPILLDFEIELMMCIQSSVSNAQLSNGQLPTVAWTLALSLFSHSARLLDPHQRKSVVAIRTIPTAWIAPTDAIPSVRLRSWVNGEVRQDNEADHIDATPLAMLQQLAASIGRDLRPGDALLLRPPRSHIAKQLPWKRRLETLTNNDRVHNLDAALRMYVDGAGFLRPGDTIRFDAGFVGHRTVSIELTSIL